MNVFENDAVVRHAVAHAQGKMVRTYTQLIHSSELTQGLRKSYYQRTQPRPNSADDTLLFADGFALQEWFLGAEKDGVVRDGVTFSVDAFGGDELLEFKSTRRSYERIATDPETGKQRKDLPKVVFDPTENYYWMERTKLYCYVHGRSRAHILVFFRFQSALHAWTVEFTQDELSECWQRNMGRRDVLVSALETKTPPSVTTCERWEDEHCPFRDNCIAELLKLSVEAA